MKGKKPLPAFGLDMPFDEALRRFIGTDPKELAENVAASKEKRKPDAMDDPPEPPAKPVD